MQGSGADLEGAPPHRVDFDGGAVAWRRFGDGPPLVLLHGGHGSWLHWARNIDAWARCHSVWVPDLPGFGESDAPRAPTLEALAAATTATLDLLVGPTTAVRLVGFSFGALVAAQLTAQRGGVSQLALLGPGGHGGARRPRGELQAWRDAADRGDDGALAKVMRHNLAMHMLHHPASIDALALRIHTDACRRARFHSKPISRAGGLAGLLRPYSGPLLLAWGEHDVTAVPEQAASALAGGHHRCVTHTVADAGHWVQYEAADQINALLLRWLQATNAERPV